MKIILGVSGSISAYKAYDILRGLIKKGHQVRVILTSGAQKFILPDTFSYLGAEEVYSAKDDFKTEQRMTNVLHIDLKNWADRLIIDPASANTIAKLAGGFCDDLLSSVYLTMEAKTKILFPAMNTQMLTNTITQQNLARLGEVQNTFIHPSVAGELICKEVGAGKLPEVNHIVEFVDCYTNQVNQRKILITTGPTSAPLDPVRYLTNPSSGKTGYELAKAYLKQGHHEVRLIYGALSTIDLTALEVMPNFFGVKVHTTEQMFQQVQKYFNTCDTYISAAAISDIEFTASPQKLKKSETLNNLEFTWAKDILKTVVAQREHQTIISFAAETGELDQNFSNKWKNKPVDLMVGNIVSNGISSSMPQGFGSDTNEYYMVKEGVVTEKLSLSKNQLADYILNFTEKNHGPSSN